MTVLTTLMTVLTTVVTVLTAVMTVLTTAVTALVTMCDMTWRVVLKRRTFPTAQWVAMAGVSPLFRLEEGLDQV
jgi:type II secretory pathway component PulK